MSTTVTPAMGVGGSCEWVSAVACWDTATRFHRDAKIEEIDQRSAGRLVEVSCSSSTRELFTLNNIRGALVTMPHKMTVFELADEVSPTARIAGAANVRRTPVHRHGRVPCSDQYSSQWASFQRSRSRPRSRRRCCRVAGETWTRTTSMSTAGQSNRCADMVMTSGSSRCRLNGASRTTRQFVATALTAVAASRRRAGLSAQPRGQAPSSRVRTRTLRGGDGGQSVAILDCPLP